jgi:hypothetical protein
MCKTPALRHNRRVSQTVSLLHAAGDALRVVRA